jgi:hypothetical protein
MGIRRGQTAAPLIRGTRHPHIRPSDSPRSAAASPTAGRPANAVDLEAEASTIEFGVSGVDELGERPLCRRRRLLRLAKEGRCRSIRRYPFPGGGTTIGRPKRAGRVAAPGQRESRRPRWLRVHAPTRTQVSAPLMTSVSHLARSRARRVVQPARGSGKSGPQRIVHQNPKVGDHTLTGRQLFAARLLTQHGAEKGASNRKCVRRPFPHQATAQEARDLQAFRIAGAGFEPATFGL